MYRGIYVAMTGSTLKLMELDNIANNISNVNTNGYKRTSFATRLYPLTEGLAQPQPSVYPDARAMASNGKLIIDQIQGTTQNTGIATDLSISGDGYFVLDVKGTQNFTRNGSFTIDKDGFLISSEGYKVLGTTDKPINLGKGTREAPVIAADGTVSVEDSPVGKIKIVKIKDAQHISNSLFSGKSDGPAKGEISRVQSKDLMSIPCRSLWP
jgi:flagellar basal body rod protein FlgG